MIDTNRKTKADVYERILQKKVELRQSESLRLEKLICQSWLFRIAIMQPNVSKIHTVRKAKINNTGCPKKLHL